MKNVQVRFSDEVYKGLERIAEEEHTTLADVVRRGLQLYGIVRSYRREGKALAIVDKSGKLQAELIIPGITSGNLDEIMQSQSSNAESRE